MEFISGARVHVFSPDGQVYVGPGTYQKETPIYMASYQIGHTVKAVSALSNEDLNAKLLSVPVDGKILERQVGLFPTVKLDAGETLLASKIWCEPMTEKEEAVAEAARSQA